MLYQAIQGISDLILMPGLINLDFADVTTIMSGMGLAIMGTGVGHGTNRAVEAAKLAISSPLLQDASIDGARGVVVNVTGGTDLTMIEVSEATSVIQEAAHEEANIIFGAVVDSSMKGEVKITVIATGFDDKNIATSNASAAKTPVDLESYAGWTQDVPAERVTTVSLAQRRVIQLPPAPASRSVALKVPGERFKKDEEFVWPSFTSSICWHSLQANIRRPPP